MLKQTVEYEDFNGNRVAEDLYFNLSKHEVIDMETAENTSLSSRLHRIQQMKDAKAMFQELKDIVLKAYGIKSEDGRKFLKSDAIREEFQNSAAFDEFLWQLFKDESTITHFINNIVPQQAIKDAMEEAEKRKISLDDVLTTGQYTPPKAAPEAPKPATDSFGQMVEPKEEPKPATPPGISVEQMEEFIRNNPDAMSSYMK